MEVEKEYTDLDFVVFQERVIKRRLIGDVDAIYQVSVRTLRDRREEYNISESDFPSLSKRLMKVSIIKRLLLNISGKKKI